MVKRRQETGSVPYRIHWQGKPSFLCSQSSATQSCPSPWAERTGQLSWGCQPSVGSLTNTGGGAALSGPQSGPQVAPWGRCPAPANNGDPSGAAPAGGQGRVGLRPLQTSFFSHLVPTTSPYLSPPFSPVLTLIWLCSEKLIHMDPTAY